MPRLFWIGLSAFAASALALWVFVAQSFVMGLLGATVATAVVVVIAMDWPAPIKAGLLASLIGIMFTMIYGVERPGVAVIGGMLAGLAAGLLAAQREHRPNALSGAIQGLIASLTAAAMTIATIFLVAMVIAPAAGADNVEYLDRLINGVPFGASMNSDIMLLLLLSAETLIGAVLLGMLAGAASAYQGKNAKLLVYAVVGLAMVLLPLIESAGHMQLLDPIIKVYVFILLALGLNIVVGYAGLLDLGYAAFFAIGAYTVGMLSSAHLGVNWSFWIVIWIAAAVAAVAGVVLGSPTLPLRGDYLAIVTLGFGEIVPVAFRNLGGGGDGTLTLRFLNFTILNQVDLTGGAKGISPISPPQLPAGIIFSPAEKIPWYYLILAIMALMIFFINRLRGSRQGRAWTALREDELAADAMGINVVRTKLLAFAMGATVSGFGGAFYGAFIGAIFPSSFEFSVSIILLCMVILGGLGNMVGVIIGGLIIMGSDVMFLPEASNLIKDVVETKNPGSEILALQDLTQLRLLLFGMVLVIMMLVRPEGLVPSARRAAELHPEKDEAMQENSTLFDAERDPSLSGH